MSRWTRVRTRFPPIELDDFPDEWAHPPIAPNDDDQKERRSHHAHRDPRPSEGPDHTELPEAEGTKVVLAVALIFVQVVDGVARVRKDQPELARHRGTREWLGVEEMRPRRRRPDLELLRLGRDDQCRERDEEAEREEQRCRTSASRGRQPGADRSDRRDDPWQEQTRTPTPPAVPSEPRRDHHDRDREIPADQHGSGTILAPEAAQGER